MKSKQSTIKRAITISGVGLHTGREVNMTLNPAPENHGIKFRRTDLDQSPVVEADVDNVVDTSRGTTLGHKEEVLVATVEHVMGSLAGMEMDNLMVDLDAPETPIMDGSAKPFIEAIETAGIEEQSADREYFEIPYNIYYSEEDRNVEMIAMPLDGYRSTVMVDYNSPVLGSQHASISEIQEFHKEIASSRTFCFLHELEELVNNNLIKGGDLNNAIVIVDKQISTNEMTNLAKLFNKEDINVKNEGILNNIDLRYQNEPARHKLLDLIGDLALIGTPIKAQVMAARPGHAANIEFARKIKKTMKKVKRKQASPNINTNKEAIFGPNEISNFLPHEHPFIYVDKIIELSEKHIVGVKNVTMTEPYFGGHFPKNPVMPGVLQIEAMSQVGGVMILSQIDRPENYATYFMKIENAKFREKVLPGDQLILKLELISPIRRGVCNMKGQAFVGNKLVTEAELMAQIVKNN